MSNGQFDKLTDRPEGTRCCTGNPAPELVDGPASRIRRSRTFLSDGNN